MKRKLLFTLLMASGSLFSFAQFTAGNLVVLRVGVGGTTAINGNTTAVSLLEFTPVGVQVGSSLDLNSTTAGSRITINGSSNEGLLKLSGDGKFLTLAGYDQPVATVATTAINIAGQKVIVSVNNDKAIDYTTKIIANDVGGNLRSATTVDKSGFWFGTSSSGVRYVPVGNTSTNAVQIAPNTVAPADVYGNIRSVGIFNNELYASVVTATNHGVSLIGSGTPSSTASQTKTALPGVTVNSTFGDFVLLDLDATTPGVVDVLYVSESSKLNKYSLVSGTWVLNSTTTPPNTGIYGLAAIKNGTAVLPGTGSGAAVFISTNSNTSDTNLQYALDIGGYNQPFNGTFSTIASAGTNYAFRGIAFTPNTTTLPVDLTSFTGKNTTNGIQLNWETASEKNNDRFDVLRSNDANNFQIITSVKGKGTSNSLNKYNYLDAQPLSGTNYYKLNQVDFDGKNTPSNVIAIKTGLTESTITAYATSKELSFTVNALKAGIVRAQIFDVAGRKILDKTINLTVGVNINTLNIADLQQGVYIAKISTDGGKTLSQKFVKE